MNKTIIKIKGMHCRSCEILIEDSLTKIDGIKNIHVSWKDKEAVVYSKRPLSDAEVRQAVIEAGYEVGVDEPASWVSTDSEIWKNASIAFVCVLVLYLILRSTGLFNISVGGGTPSSLAVVFLIGITAGLSTCMALVGGLILGISAKFAEKHPEATPAQKFRPHLFFNLGRIASYFLLGGLIGLAGRAFQFSGTVLGTLIVVVGVVMLVVGLQLTELFPVIKGISFSLPASISKFFGVKKHHEREYSHANSALTGALTFFLPCGFTQAMQLYAMSTGSFWSGALIMGTFALGTAPGLLGIGGLTSVVKGIFARRFFMGAGFVVVALAIFNISNGMNLSGLTSALTSSNSPTTATTIDPNVKFVDGIQVVNMTQLATGYSPNTFTIKAGVPVKWVVNSVDSNSCAASLYSQKLNIRKFLNLGENIIEFTPTEVGTIPFSCSMGMYRGSFNVVAGNGQSNTGSGSSQVVQSSASTNQPIEIPQKDTALSAQTITATYTLRGDISPKDFTVKANQPVKFEIDPKDDGQGCMSSITLPGLTNNYEIIQKDTPIIFNFTPKPGKYQITCAMGVPRGTIIAE